MTFHEEKIKDEMKKIADCLDGETIDKKQAGIWLRRLAETIGEVEKEIAYPPSTQE